MGVERAVTRWYVQRQLLSAEIMRLEGVLDPLLQDVAPEQDGAASGENAEAAHVQLEEVRKRLKTQGHCPRPMMG